MVKKVILIVLAILVGIPLVMLAISATVVSIKRIDVEPEIQTVTEYIEVEVDNLYTMLYSEGVCSDMRDQELVVILVNDSQTQLLKNFPDELSSMKEEYWEEARVNMWEAFWEEHYDCEICLANGDVPARFLHS